jgi:UPF0716 family protein affecting phage T7 exclusion
LRRATWLERGLFVVAAFMLIDPGALTDAVGLVVLAVGLLLQWLRPAVAGAPGAVPEGVPRP